MLNVWFSEPSSDDPQDLENIAHLTEIESGESAQPAAAGEGKPAEAGKAKAGGEKAARQPRSKRAAEG